MLKKKKTFILFIFSFFFLFLAKPVLALELTLISEFYETGTLTKIYEDANGEQHIRSFGVPEQLHGFVDEDENPLLSAKQHLTVYYILTEDDIALAELNNETIVNDQGEHHFSVAVSENLHTSINEDEALVKSFVDHELNTPNIAEKYKDPEEERIYDNYMESEFYSENPTVDSTNDLTNDLTDEDIEEAAEEAIEEPVTETNADYVTYVTAGLAIVLLFGIVFFIFKRR